MYKLGTWHILTAWVWLSVSLATTLILVPYQYQVRADKTFNLDICCISVSIELGTVFVLLPIRKCVQRSDCVGGGAPALLSLTMLMTWLDTLHVMTQSLLLIVDTLSNSYGVINTLQTSSLLTIDCKISPEAAATWDCVIAFLIFPSRDPGRPGDLWPGNYLIISGERNQKSDTSSDIIVSTGAGVRTDILGLQNSTIYLKN